MQFSDFSDAELRNIEAASGERAVSAITQAPQHIINRWLEIRAIALGMRPGPVRPVRAAVVTDADRLARVSGLLGTI
jgi:hypothetical protein